MAGRRGTHIKRISNFTRARSGNIVERFLYWMCVFALWAFIGFCGLIFSYGFGLPETDNLWKISYTPEIQFFSATDRLIGRRGRLTGRPLNYNDLSQYMIHAVLAIEDRRFFDHFGIDPRGLLRALLANLKAGETVQGGSTLTQQLAKNVFLTNERTFKRKVQELLLAFWIEARLTKQEILTIYLNRVYFGAGAYGLHAAAQIYFARPVQELTLAEAAILAGLLKAPSYYTPLRNPELAFARAKIVLNAMKDVGFISAGEYLEAVPENVRIVTTNSSSVHYAIDWVVEQLPDFIGRPRTDLDVITTLSPAMQRAAEEVVAANLEKYGRAYDVDQAALVVLSPNGAVRAMVGGRSYADTQYNRAVLAKRQPGSAFKPFVYLTALEAGLNRKTKFEDAPFSVGDWTPRNYDDTYQGDVSMDQALAESINTVAVQVSEWSGRENVIATARRMGIDSYLAPHPSIALGAFELSLLELTTAYAGFANGGFQVFPHIIDSVNTGTGALLYERTSSPAHRIIEKKHLKDINNMLVKAVEKGTGKRARLDNFEVAGKTGTSQNWRDAWFVGYTQDIIVGVWVGNDDNSPMNGVTGGGLPAIIWSDFMRSPPVANKRIKSLEQELRRFDRNDTTPNYGEDDPKSLIDLFL